MLRRLLTLSISTRTLRAIVLFSLLLFLSLGLSHQFSVVRAANFIVNSFADPGIGICDLAECTLREAIDEANVISGADTIIFNIAGNAPETIILASALPDITETLSIDGGTQTGGAACDAPPIILTGGGGGNGFNIVSPNASGSSIRGFIITTFGGHGISLSGADNNTIACNDIGGSTGNSGDGINITNSSGNTIGGAGSSNKIAFNNGAGVNVTLGDNNTISQNAIFSNGLDPIVLVGGANNNAASPILTLANYDGTNVTVTGTLTSAGNTTFDLEYFVCDGVGEAGDFLGGGTVNTDGAGAGTINDTFAVTLSSAATIGATATDSAGNTSQFSTCIPLTEVPVYDSTPEPNTTTPINIGSSVVMTPITRADAVIIENIGAGLLTVSFTVTGANAADFTVDTANNSTVSPGIPLDVSVTCTPSAPALLEATLNVTHDGIGTPTSPVTYPLECTGTGGPVPDYESAPPEFPDPASTIDLGSSLVNIQLNVFNAITISNVGSAPLNIFSYTLGNPAEFNVVNFPATIGAGGADEQVQIQCTPSAVGLRTSTLNIDTNDPTQPVGGYLYNLECTGDPGTPEYTSTPAVGDPIELGSTLVGTPITDANALVISNGAGTGPLNISDIDLVGGDIADFTLNTLSLMPIAMGGSASISLTCNPIAAGTRTTTLRITHDAPTPASPVDYTVNCTGLSPITVAPATLPDGVVGTPYSETITATGGSGTYVSYVVTTGTAPAGLILNGATGILSGSPTTTVGSPFTFTVTVTDSLGNTGVQPYTIAITATPIVIAPATVPDGTVGTPYTTQTITATGGVAPITFTHSGNVPPGLTFDDATGTLSGTPTTDTGSPFTFTVTATDSVGTVANQPYTIAISPAAAIVIAPATVPDGTVGTPYTTQTITATGGVAPITFTHSGNVPPGLTFDDATGTLSGTPTTDTGSPFTFTVTATDSVGTVANQPYTIAISPAAAIVIAPATVPDGTVGTPYTTQTITATGGVAPITFTHTGNVPPGLTFDDATGTLSGTPTTATGSPFSFTVTATDSVGTVANQPYTIAISPAAAIVIAPATVPDGTVGTPYTTQTITATGGVAPITFTHTGNVPPGLTFDNATGTLSGTPTTATGSPFSFTVTATDSVGTVANQPYTITINPPAPLLITPLTMPNGRVGTVYVTQTVTTSGGVAPVTLTHSGNVPPGLTFDDASGTLFGTPNTIVGSPFTFTVTATDSLGTVATQNYTIIIDPPAALDIQPASVPNGTVGVVYAAQTISAVGGVPPITLTHDLASLPPGLAFDNATGVLSGTPSTVGNYNFEVTATDSAGTTTTRTYVIVISTAPTIVVNPATLPAATRNLPYTRNITASGGTAPYTFSVTTGTLPNGLTLSTTGVLSGTPTVANSFTFTVQARDSLGNTGTRIYTLVVGVGVYDSAPAPGGLINVGTVQIGTSISTTLTTYNRGTASIIVGTPSITNGNFADFAVFTNLTPQFPYAINGGGQQAITVRCTPSGAGVRQALLTLPISGDPNRATAIYVLQCTGSGTPVITATPIGFVPTAPPFVPTVTPVVPANGTVGEVKGLAMRTGPYLGATLIGKAVPGIEYPILAQSNDEGGGITWYLITVDQVTGWVSGLYLNVAGNIAVVPFQGSIFDQIDGAPDVGVSARAMSIIDIRRRPSGRSAILGQVPQDGIVRLLGRTRQNGGDFWVQVNYNGMIGWIPAAPIAVNGSTANVPIR